MTMARGSSARWAMTLLVLMLLVLLACRSKKKKGVTINRGDDGGVTLTGGPPLKGDPNDCAAFKACCTAENFGIACALTQTAAKGDCKAALHSVRRQITENGLAHPPGCL